MPFLATFSTFYVFRTSLGIKMNKTVKKATFYIIIICRDDSFWKKNEGSEFFSVLQLYKWKIVQKQDSCLTSN